MADLDWNRLWAESRKQQSWKGKTADDWDRRSTSFAKRHAQSPYTTKLLEILQPKPWWRVLDIGSGPGNLTIPLAKQVDHVTAIDFSAKMLALLKEKATTQNITNISTIQASWDDDWPHIGHHDIVLASRSLAVIDLAGALSKIDRYAGKMAVVVERAGNSPFDPELFAAVGRPFLPGPDYIHVINLLHDIGIFASVDFISLEAASIYQSFEEAWASSAWMIEDLTKTEQQKMHHYLDAHLEILPDGRFKLHRPKPPRWAVIYWHTA